MSTSRVLDEKDLELVRLLEANAWLTHTELGERIHLSASAVQRRIEKLRSEGVITGASANVDKTKIGKGLRVYLILELSSDNKQSLDKLMQDLESFDEVAHVELVAGRFDIIMTLDCSDTDSFTEFAMSKLNTNENIKHCWTLVRLKKLF